MSGVVGGPARDGEKNIKEGSVISAPKKQKYFELTGQQLVAARTSQCVYRLARSPEVAAETLLLIYARRGELRRTGMTDGSSPETLMMFESLE